jgi:hypothetical protein
MPGTEGIDRLRPPPAIHRSRERLEVARAALALLKDLHRLSVPALGRGQALEAIAVYLAVKVGHLDQDGPGPMTATKLAYETGLPRATVLRKLFQLGMEGTVRREGDAYLLDEARANAAETLDTLDRLIRVLQGAAASISDASEMDSETLPGA